jgi:hypothetical protein
LNSVGFDDIVQVAFDLVIKDLSFTIGINIVGASFKHDFGSTFGVKSSVEAVFGLVVFIELDDGGHSLSGGVEWESDHWVAGIVLSHVVEIGIASLDELEHGDFGGRPVRDGTLSVARNTLLDEVQVVLVGAEAVGVNGSCTVWVLDFLVMTAPDLGPSHLVLSKSSGFVGADVVGTSHDFTRGQSLHEVLVLKHFGNGVSERDHDCKWKTLWDSDDNDGDTDDQVCEPALDHALDLTVANLIPSFFS